MQIDRLTSWYIGRHARHGVHWFMRLLRRARTPAFRDGALFPLRFMLVPSALDSTIFTQICLIVRSSTHNTAASKQIMGVEEREKNVGMMCFFSLVARLALLFSYFSSSAPILLQ